MIYNRLIGPIELEIFYSEDYHVLVYGCDERSHYKMMYLHILYYTHLVLDDFVSIKYE